MKRVLLALVIVVLLVVAGAGVALSLVDANRFRPQIQTALSQAIGRPVTLGALHVSPWSGALEADDIRIADDPAFSNKPFIQAAQLEVGVRLWPLLVHRELAVTSLTLDKPVVRLLQQTNGQWNFTHFGSHASSDTPTSAASPQGSAAFTADALNIRDGTLVLRRAVGGMHRYSHLQLSAKHVAATAAFPFTMQADMPSGGHLKVDGKIGPWDPSNAMLTPLHVHLVMHGLDLVAAGLMQKGQGVGGIIDIDTQLHAMRGDVTSKGTITAHKLQLVASGSPSPEPLSVDYMAGYQINRHIGHIADTTLGTRKARLALDGTFDNRGKTMQLDIQIRGNKLPVDDLQPLLPAFGVVLPKNSHLRGGTLNVALHAHGALDALHIDGPVAINDTTLAGYSLGSKMGGALSLAGIHAPSDTLIKHAEAGLAIQPSGIRADPVKAEVSDLGSITGKGRMAADGSLDFNMLVKLASGITGAQGVGGMLGGSKAGRILGSVLGESSSQGIGVHVTGTASDPRFRLDPAAVAGLLQSGLIHKQAPASAHTPATSTSSSAKDVIGNMLRGVLKKKTTGSSGN
jgi:AsmA protein